MGAAIGAGSFFGIKLEEPSDVYSVGHPIPAGLSAAVTAPAAAPTSAASVGAGNITALQVQWRFAYIKQGGFVSVPSAWSIALDLSAKNGELSDLTNSADSTVIGKVIERQIGSTRCVIAYIWNNTATTYTDTFSTTSASLDFSVKLNAYGETGANGEFKFPYVEAADPSVEPKTITSNGITGGASEPKGVAGPVPITLGVKGPANPGELAHYLMTGGYTVVKYGVKAAAWVTDLSDVDEPTRKYVLTPKRGGVLGNKSLSFWEHGGGVSVNRYVWQGRANESTLKTAQGKVVEQETKFICGGYSPHGLPAEALDAGAPTPLVLPVLFGRRSDAAHATANTCVKVTAAPTTGTMGIKAKDATGAAYDGAEQTIVYNQTSNKMSQQTGMFSDKLRLNDQNDAAMGYGSGRPLMVIVGGDIELHEINDEYTFPPKPHIPDPGTTPGVDDGTYTGFGPKRLASPDFTEAHCSLTDDGTGILITGSQIKITDPKKLIEGHGIEAAYGYDVQDSGMKNVELQFTHYYEDLSYQTKMELIDRGAYVWKLEGGLILVTPGTFSAQRETVQVEIAVGEIVSAKPTGGEGIRMETVTVATKDPGDGVTDTFTITIITREDIPIPV